MHCNGDDYVDSDDGEDVDEDDDDVDRFLLRGVHLLEDRDKWWVALLQNYNNMIMLILML